MHSASCVTWFQGHGKKIKKLHYWCKHTEKDTIEIYSLWNCWNLRSNLLFYLLQPLTPSRQSISQHPDLLTWEHSWLHPRNMRCLVDLINRASNKFQANVGKDISRSVRRIRHCLFYPRTVTHLRAFMTRCSTSSSGSRVSWAIVWKLIVRSSAFRLKTDSMSAMRRIFCRRKG